MYIRRKKQEIEGSMDAIMSTIFLGFAGLAVTLWMISGFLLIFIGYMLKSSMNYDKKREEERIKRDRAYEYQEGFDFKERYYSKEYLTEKMKDLDFLKGYLEQKCQNQDYNEQDEILRIIVKHLTK